ncbi:MAG: zinc ribbon domain-containing protein [Polyangiaceae bacterium]|nr:zinc ribbon domain-containing protein [Polyangiaceae bacterium]
MTYSYICTSCGHSWEAEQRISEPPLKDCPSCKAASAKRQIAGPANFILKGGGWYSDLYSSSSGKKSESSSSSSDKGSSSSDKGGSADKPAEKKSEAAASPAPSTPSSTPSTGSSSS